MARVTGIGGVFLKARDPQALGDWYKRHLGVPYNDGFAKLAWLEDQDPNALTIWSPFEADTTYFGSDNQQVMVNFRVDDLDGLLADLVAADVEIVPERSEEEGAGRFAWIIDCEGNRVELWEPKRNVGHGDRNATDEDQIRALIDDRVKAVLDRDVHAAVKDIAPHIVSFDVVNPLRRIGSNE